MKRTIRRWTIFIFTVLLFAAAVIIAWFNYEDARDDTISIYERAAKGCAGIVCHLLDEETLEVLTDPSNEEVYVYMRDMMRNLSQAFDFEYLYVYTVDVDTKVRKYVICVASDDEADKHVREVRGLGSESDAPLDEGELSALAGLVKSEPEFQSTEFGDDLVWIYPYMNDAGEVKALIGMDYDFQISKTAVIWDMIKAFIPTLFIMTELLLMLLLLINRRIAEPLHQISDRMNSFVANRNKPLVPLNIQSVEEINEISDSFEKMSGDIIEYLQNIEALTQDRIQSQLQMNIARRIQNGLVPERADLTGNSFSMCAITRPAREVGGDFYDCFLRDKNKLCAFIGDVSGKGISAAFFMATAKTVIRENMKTGKTCAEALRNANNELYAMNPEGLFATAFALILNLETGELQYANAGHNYPVILGQDIRLLRPDPGIVLGLLENAEIRDERICLKINQGILLYTDGVTETVNDQRVFFGEKRLLEAAGKDVGRNAVRTIEEISAALKQFSGSCEQFDDIAMLTLWYTKAGREKTWEELPVDGSAFSIVKAKVLELVGNTERARKVLLACDEILTNIVEYSGANEITFCCTEEDGNIIVQISDNGVYFDPVEYSSEERSFDQLDQGGMGLRIARQTVSEMRYERAKDRNIVTMVSI
ncbi:MAG: SpoIIE family protein phosphatase [Lachnospiraceae bacterium]|nr:SpoIIE family protein phosphatase [Lachnospiraceae bacterium]